MKRGKRILAGLMSLCMAISGISPLTEAKGQTKEEARMLLYYNFENVQNGVIEDCSGNGNDGVLKGEGAAAEDHTLTLPGGAYESNAAYVQLPTGIFDNKQELTISLWLKNETGKGNYSAMFFGSDNQFPKDYWLLNPCAPSGKFKSVITNGCYSKEYGLEGVSGCNVAGPDSDDQWHLYTTVITKDSITGYYDREQYGPVTAEGVVSSFGTNMVAYLGRSSYHDIFYKGGIRDVRVYEGAYTAEQVADLYEKSDLYADADMLTLPETPLADITLPAKGTRGSDITWSSSNEEAISSAGKLGSYPESTDVTLTAVLKKDGVQTEKSFLVHYTGGGEEGRLRERINRFDLGVTYATQDIVLPDSYDGITIRWSGNEYISDTGKVTRPQQDTKVVLKAVFVSGDIQVEREFEITVAAKAAATLATYVAAYEYNMGVEYAQYPSNRYTDNRRTDVLYYAISQDGQSYTGLNNNKAVLYPKSFYQMGSPSLFRKGDGTYGLIASNNNSTDEIIVWDSKDLIFFENQRVVTLKAGAVVKNPMAVYDNAANSYAIYWEDENGQGYRTDTTDFVKFGTSEKTDYRKSAVTGTLPEYALREEASLFELTQAEYDRLMNKFGEVHSVSVSGNEEICVEPGESVTLPEQLTVNYSDGSTAKKNVTWDLESLGADLNKLAEGTYEVSGTIRNETYNSPLALYRADPFVAYNEQDGMYYLTGSNLNQRSAAGGGAYSSLVIRKASTINGLTDAKEYEIFTTLNTSDTCITGWYWAPELHYIGGKWRIIAMSGRTDVGGTSYGWRQSIFTCNGDDLTKAENWSWDGYIKAGTNGLTPGAFDTTYFEYNGQCYYVTPARERIYITTVDTSDLTTPTGPLVEIASAERGYESNIGSMQNIEEASSVLIHDGKIFIIYAGSTVDMHYCVCMLYADLDSDLMDPSSWKKYPYPLLNTADITKTVAEPTFDENGNLTSMGSYEGAFGPGHNSFTVDESGNPVIIYHAREWSDSYDTDTVLFGNEAFEGSSLHKAELTGSVTEKKNVGNVRYARAGESFSYDMAVDTSSDRYSYVICQFMHGDNGKTVKLTVEGEPAGTHTLSHEVNNTNMSADTLYKKSFRIPQKALDAAREVTVDGKTYKVVRVTVESAEAGTESAALVNSLAITSTVYEGAVGDAKYGLVDPGRHAYANSVHFGADGFPICNMTADQILAPELKNVTIRIKVEKKPVKDPNTDKPGNNTKPGNDTKPGSDTKPTDDNNNGGKDTAGDLQKGGVYQAGNYRYRITDLKKKTVSVVKAVKAKKTIVIGNTVTLNGVSFTVTSIGKNAFKNNKKVTTVKLGKNIKTIGANAFYGCKKLKKLTVSSGVLKKVEKNAFKGIHAKARIKVPAKQYKKYKKLLRGKGQKSSVRITK